MEPLPLVELDDLERSITKAVAKIQVQSMSQFNIQVGNIMGQLDFLALDGGLALLVGGVGIANTMLMSAVDAGRIRRDASQRLDPEKHPGAGDRGKFAPGAAVRPGGQRGRPSEGSQS